MIHVRDNPQQRGHVCTSQRQTPRKIMHGAPCIIFRYMHTSDFLSPWRPLVLTNGMDKASSSSNNFGSKMLPIMSALCCPLKNKPEYDGVVLWSWGSPRILEKWPGLKDNLASTETQPQQHNGFTMIASASITYLPSYFLPFVISPHHYSLICSTSLT